MKSKTQKAKQILCVILAVFMLAGLIPAQLASAVESNSNNVSGPVEEWVYTPSVPATDSTTLAVAGADEIEAVGSTEDGSSADIIKVTVKATEKATDKEVPVENAEVKLYVGSEFKFSKPTNSEGVAEISLAGLTIEERQNATISASKIVSRGTAIDGTARDALFNNYPKYDSDGDGINDKYYRYTLELHSEDIDPAGNWNGEEVPESKESNKVDIVFAIDATGSMSDEINDVKDSLAAFSENLIAKGLNIRFSIIEYRDITCSEPTIVHEWSGSHWITSTEGVVSTLQSISVSGGGDGPETVIDALGYVADNSFMKWRSDAYRFAFVLTDANYKTNNNFGYSSLSQLAVKLAEMEIVTSVITSSSYKSTYSELYTTTGGIYANIYSGSFEDEMMALSDSIIKSVTREMNLTISEPRLLVNLSVCYFANDKTSQSEAYKNSVKQMLNEYANRMAESTDGHVLIDKILLFSTNNRTNFYDTTNIASMADIRIETEENDDGKETKNVQVHSNAYLFGFFVDDTYLAEYDETAKKYENFSNLKNGDELDGRASFYRIQMSGIEGAGWDYSMIDSAYKYSTTVMHETGHYLLGFLDEYLNAVGYRWNNNNGKYEDNESQYSRPDGTYYGLMDNQHDDFEMSKRQNDYAYITGSFAETDILNHTYQSYNNLGSCEDSFSTLLTDSSLETYHSDLKEKVLRKGNDFNLGKYVSTYKKAPNGEDRTATYSYAELSESDYLTPALSGSGGGGGGGGAWSLRVGAGAEATETSTSLADVSYTANGNTVTLSLTKKGSATYSVGIMKAGDEDYTAVTLSGSGSVLTGSLNIAAGELAEVRITAKSGSTEEYNTYYVDRSGEVEKGYLYMSADNATMAYVTTDAAASYMFIADNTSYVNGNYVSVNQATRIQGENGGGFNSGEIYSVASYMAEIDYSTLQWFKYAGGVWTALATDISEEENMNLGARADLSGAGTYVLLAKKASTGGVASATNLSYEQSTDLDAVVTVSFDDANTTSKYYNVYYSEEEFTDKNADNVVCRSFHADSTDLTINLLERGRTVYAAVEIVLEDGRRSALSEIILIGGEADSDGDGIPDWYCNKYLLWGKDGEDKDIANSDDDGDGLTNLEEYLGGSDPTNPNDPVHTTNVPVESIAVSAEEITVNIGKTATVTAVITPDNATDKEVFWTSSDESIATISVADGICTITGIEIGETMIYAVSADGGYSAGVKVIVTKDDAGFWTGIMEGELELRLGDEKAGMFTFKSNRSGGWSIKNEEGLYLTIADGVLAASETEFFWQYSYDYRFTATVRASGSYYGTTYYLCLADGVLAALKNYNKYSIASFYAHIESIMQMSHTTAGELMAKYPEDSFMTDNNGYELYDDMYLATGDLLFTPDGERYIITVKGDANGDGEVLSSDARLLLRASVGLEILDKAQMLAGDFENDGKITSGDARMALRVSVGLETLTLDE